MSEADCQRELVAMMEFRKLKYREAAVFVDFFGWFRNDDAMFLAMEYMVLGDLEQNLLEIEDSPEHLGAALSEEETQEITRQILEGLKIMHAEGFAHRDLKPQNVFVVQKQPQWWVKLGDFGLSKQRTDQTAFRTQAGTQQYMAPELYYYVQDLDVTTSEYTSAIDLWALGCIIYRIIVGAVPFPNLLSLRNFCRDSKKVPLNIPSSMEEAGNFIMKLLQPNPECRPLAKTQPIISMQAAQRLDRMSLSTSQGNYNTSSHKGLQSQYTMTTTTPLLKQPNQGLALEPSQLLSREPVGQPAKPTSDSNDFETKQSPLGISIDPRDLSQAPPSPLRSSLERRRSFPGVSSIESRRSFPRLPDLKPSQDDITIEPREAQADEARRFKAQGNEAMVDQNYTKALDLYTQALKISPKSEIYHCLSLCAGAHNSMGNYAAACHDAEAAIAAEPKYAMAWNRLGHAKLLMGSLADVQTSIDAYTKAIEYGGQEGSENSWRGLENARKKLKELRDVAAKLTYDQIPERATISTSPLPEDSSLGRSKDSETPPVLQSYDTPENTPVPVSQPNLKKPSFFSRIFKRDDPDSVLLRSTLKTPRSQQETQIPRKQYTIKVKTLAGNIVGLDVVGTCTIGEVKIFLCATESVPAHTQLVLAHTQPAPAHIQLVFLGKLLEDYHTLGYYNIGPNKTLQEVMQIFAKTLAGKIATIYTTPQGIVLDIKRQIDEKEGISPDQQSLIFRGKQLEDYNTMIDHNINANDTVHMVLRLKGGPPAMI
ncbi:hypothetical protein B7463_g1636, partial [Scytalidium lignicola]